MTARTSRTALSIGSYGLRLFAVAGLLMLIVCLIPLTARAAVSAHIDRDTVNEGETFTLSLTVTGGNDEQPDVAPLQKDFEVLGTAQRSEVQIINGSVESHRSWNITLSPRHAGKLIIPPITLGSDTSAALAVSVVPATASSDGGADQGDVFVEVNATPDSVYVQAQLLYTVRLYYAVPLRQGTLSEPTLDNAIVQKLGDDSKFETQRNGRRYQVVERRYAIFPQRSGALEIPAVVFDGEVADRSRRSGDPFFDTFNPSTRHVRLRSRVLDIPVAAQPATYHGTNWLPAEDLSLEEKWSPETPQFRVGEPVTRTVTLRAKGLSASQLPDLPAVEQTGLKLYPDQPQSHSSTSDGALVSEREQKIAMIPTQAGELSLPAIHLDWWDTQANRERSAELPARTIHVLPALASSAAGAASPVPAPVTARAAAPVKAGKTVPAPASAGARFSSPNAPHSALTSDIWIALAIFFALTWLVTLLLWWRSRRSPRAQSKPAAAPDLLRPAVNRVNQACRQNDKPALKSALLAWAQLQWPNDPPLSLGALARCVDDERLGAQIARLDQFLYEAHTLDWQPDQLLEAFSAYAAHSGKRARQDKPQDKAVALEPLYPIKSRVAGR